MQFSLLCNNSRMRELFLLFFCIISTLSFPIDTFIDDTQNEIIGRALEERSEPISYTIELTPYFNGETDKEFTFDGIVNLRFRVNEDGRTSLKLNSRKLTYKVLPTIEDQAPVPEPIQVINNLEELNAGDDVIEFKFDKTLKRDGEYSIKFEYTGLLEDDMSGFYRSSYKQDDETM